MYGFSFQDNIVPQEGANAYEGSLMGGPLGFQYSHDTGKHRNSIDVQNTHI